MRPPRRVRLPRGKPVLGWRTRAVRTSLLLARRRVGYRLRMAADDWAASRWSPARLAQSRTAGTGLWRLLRSRRLVVLVVLAVVGAAGIAVGRGALGDAPQSGRERVTSQRGAATAIETRDFRFTAPAGWSPAKDAPAIPGLTSRRAVALVEASYGTHLRAALLPPFSSTLLPEALLDRLDEPPGRPERVRLGGGLTAYYYGALSLADRPNLRLDVYAAPATAGVATVACVGDGAYLTGPLPECLAAARTLRLANGAPVRLDQDTAFWLRVAAEISGVDAVRERARGRLETADTAAEQAEATHAVEVAYDHAANVLVSLAQHSSSLLAIVTQLRDNAATYGRISSALARQDRGAVARDREVALAGEERVKTILSEQR